SLLWVALRSCAGYQRQGPVAARLTGDLGDLPVLCGFGLTLGGTVEGVEEAKVGGGCPERNHHRSLGDAHHLDPAPRHVLLAGVFVQAEERLDGGTQTGASVEPLTVPQVRFRRVADWISTGTEIVVCSQHGGGEA